jgi:hypothetical protein
VSEYVPRIGPIIDLGGCSRAQMRELLKDGEPIARGLDWWHPCKVRAGV